MGIIYYKFASAKDFSIIQFEGSVISVDDFKRRVLESQYKSKKKSDSNNGGLCFGTDLDFIVMNAQTDEHYDDDSTLIPDQSSVLLRRVPGNRRRKPIDTSSIVILGKQVPLSSSLSISRKTSSSASNSSSSSDLLTESTVTSLSVNNSNSDQSESALPGLSRAEEDSKIRALVNTPALGYWQSNNGSRRRMGFFGFDKKVAHPHPHPHEGYVCRRCNVPGHFIQHCPTNGDHNYDIKRVKKNVAPLLEQNEYAFDREVGCLPSASVTAASQVPPELLCPLCNHVIKEAVFTSKCCYRSFCDRCIRDQLINSKLKCFCGATDVLTDSLIPNITVRNTIKHILDVGVVSSNSNSTSSSSCGSNSMSKASSSAAELSEKVQKPFAADTAEEDVGNKRKHAIAADAPVSGAKKARIVIGSMRSEAPASLSIVCM